MRHIKLHDRSYDQKYRYPRKIKYHGLILVNSVRYLYLYLGFQVLFLKYLNHQEMTCLYRTNWTFPQPHLVDGAGVGKSPALEPVAIQPHPDPKGPDS